MIKMKGKKVMKKYIQPATMVAEVAMTAALLNVSAGTMPDLNIGIGGGGDPGNGR